MKVKFKRLTSTAKLPTYANPGDAGLDVYCAHDVDVWPHSRCTIRTGIAAQFDDGYVALVWDKSGIAQKKGLTVLGGVLDSGYRGEWVIILYNTTQITKSFFAGEKIAQVLMQPVMRAEIEEVEELDETERGNGAFGSSGNV